MKEENMKWIERMGLAHIEGLDKMQFDIEVPMGAEFIGAQHDATILVMLVKDRFGARNPGRSNRNMEKRSVLRVKDGMMIKDMRAPHENESRYIGSDNGWHLFEVQPKGLTIHTRKEFAPTVTVKES